MKSTFKIPSTWHAWYSMLLGSFGMSPSIFRDGNSTQNPPEDSIDPGESSSDFGLLDHEGPPVVSEWRVIGWAPVPILDDARGVIISGGREYKVGEWGDTILNRGDSLPNATMRKNKLTVFTIGPSTPPKDIVVICDTFIVNLIGQVRAAADMGWIKHDQRKDRDDDDDDHGKKKGDEKGKKKSHDKDDDESEDDEDDSDMNDADKRLPGVAKSIIKKLTKVRRECLRGKFGSAREKLRALIKQVNAQRGKKLTEEAYALIKFNAEFLLE